MTDLLDKPSTGGPTGPNRPSGVGALTQSESVVDNDAASTFDLSGPARVLLATLSATAAVIHFAMTPSHMDASSVEGIGFAIAGWIQIILALTLASRPSRLMLKLAIVVNLVLIGVWAASRTVGLPIGAYAGRAELATLVDLACVGFEAALVLGASALIFRPNLGRDLSRASLGAGAIVPLAVIALATTALASPSATNHGGAQRFGDTATSVAGESGGAAMPAGHDDGHAHAGDPAAMPEDDKGASELMNGHNHGVADVAVDSETQAQLDAQLALTKPLIESYPTVAAAEAAGFRRQGPFAPGLGTHYGKLDGKSLNPDGVMDPEDIARPTLIYDGIDPESKLTGFMYLVFDKTEPPGFAGPNDHWHYHTNVCMKVREGGGVDTPFGADQEVNQAQCDTVGGQLLPFTGYMVHVWTVPGYESPKGVFSDTNPKITCADGTYYMIPLEEIGTKTSLCKS